MKARLALLATMFVVVVLNACGDPTSLKASGITSIDTLNVFALSETPPSYPSGISLLARQPVRVDGNANFDIALDIGADGNAIVYPVKQVVSVPSGGRSVGLQKLTVTFDSVLAAPKDGYQVDTTAFVLVPGETLIIESQHNFQGDICQFALNPNIFAKLAVD
ncbi:MAG TPA: hypothetical protein VEM14_00145, partial [Gemmatimonadaceae bacterium]|nr:hypothetical protein [Gemmatimonadaceae bacterium]